MTLLLANIALVALISVLSSTSVEAFTASKYSHRRTILSSNLLFSSASDAPSDINTTPDAGYTDVSGVMMEEDDEVFDVELFKRRSEMKQDLLAICASWDRGFSASKKAREQVDVLIRQLEAVNPTPVNANRGVDGKAEEEGTTITAAPLEGKWRMIWTTALDVLNLGASPIATPAAIYQVIEPPIATNIIDFVPRAQNLFPSSVPSSLFRAEVKTRASKRPNDSNRVGLNFESVKVFPVEVFGVKADFLPPISLNFPQINIEDLPGVNPDTAPGFFDVIYLDSDMLIIEQNAPGGYFVSIKVDDSDP